MQLNPQQKSYIRDETMNTTPQNIRAILLVVCRLLPANHLIPTESLSSPVLQVRCCVSLHPLGGAQHKTTPFPNCNMHKKSTIYLSLIHPVNHFGPLRDIWHRSRGSWFESSGPQKRCFCARFTLRRITSEWS